MILVVLMMILMMLINDMVRVSINAFGAMKDLLTLIILRKIIKIITSIVFR
jgi:hypothetical protein